MAQWSPPLPHSKKTDSWLEKGGNSMWSLHVLPMLAVSTFDQKHWLRPGIGPHVLYCGHTVIWQIFFSSFQHVTGSFFFYTDSFWSVTLDLSFNSLSLFWCEGKAFEGRGQREWDFHTICLRQLFCCMICFTIIFYLVSQFYRLRYKLCITGLWLKAKFFISPMSNYVLWMAESL